MNNINRQQQVQLSNNKEFVWYDEKNAYNKQYKIHTVVNLQRNTKMFLMMDLLEFYDSQNFRLFFCQ